MIWNEHRKTRFWLNNTMSNKIYVSPSGIPKRCIQYGCIVYGVCIHCRPTVCSVRIIPCPESPQSPLH